MTADLRRRLDRLEAQNTDGASVLPVVVYGRDEDPDDAAHRVFGDRPPPRTVVFLPDNGRGPQAPRPAAPGRMETET